MTVLAFKSELGVAGSAGAIVSVILFGYSTMLVNCYFAENAFAFVFKGNRAFVYIVRVTALVSAVYGATGHYLAIWNLYDFIMCLTVFINIVCLVIMRKDVKFETDRLLSALAVEERGSYCPRDDIS